MASKPGTSGTSQAKAKLTTKTTKRVSPATSKVLRKKVLLQNAASSGKTMEEEENHGTLPISDEMNRSADTVIHMVDPEELAAEDLDNILIEMGQEAPSENQSSITLDTEAESAVLGKCKPSQRTDDEWSDADSATSLNSRRSSILPPAYKRAGISMDLATQRANDFLLSGKEALEKAGNMKRDCKLEVHNCLQGLYETVLSLSDSRSRHRLGLEQERCRSAKELVRIERAHNKQLTEIHSTVLNKLTESFETIRNTSKSVEAIRSWLSYEMDEPIKAISKIHLQVQGLVTRAQPHPAPPALIPLPAQIQSELGTKLSAQVNEMTQQISLLTEMFEQFISISKETEKKTIVPEVIQADTDTVITEIQELKQMISDIKTTPPCITTTINDQSEDIKKVLDPIISTIKSMRNDISEIKEFNTSQLAFQGNSGVGAELAIAEMKEKIDELKNCLSAPPMESEG